MALLAVSLGVGHVHAFGGVASNFYNAHDSVGTQCLKQFQELDVRMGLHRTRGAGLRPGSAGQDNPFDLLEQRPRLVAQVQTQSMFTVLNQNNHGDYTTFYGVCNCRHRCAHPAAPRPRWSPPRPLPRQRRPVFLCVAQDEVHMPTAASYVEVDPVHLLPTGKLASVDFRTPKRIGKDIDQGTVSPKGGYLGC